MIEIPLIRKGNALFFYCRINGSSKMEFLLDTGCPIISISKEMADMLFLTRRLKEKDIVGHETSSYGGHITTREEKVMLKSLTIGKVKLKNVETHLNDRYGGMTLFGMKALDQLKDYSIKADKILVDDGKDNVTVTAKTALDKQHNRKAVNYLKKLRKIKDDSGKRNFMFEYSKHILLLNACLQSSIALIIEGKHREATANLEEFRSLIQKNVEDDEQHPRQKGAFLTAYLYFHLGRCYFLSEQYEKAVGFYEKAKPFFHEQSSVIESINNDMSVIEAKANREAWSHPEEPKLVPPYAFSVEDDIKEYDLQPVEIIDNVYGNGEKKTAYMGFKNFREAFQFSVHHRKRMEVIQQVNGIWQRTGNLPTDNLNTYDLETGDKYLRLSHIQQIKSLCEEKLRNMDVDGKDKELAEFICKNRDIAIEEYEKKEEEHKDNKWKVSIILKEDDLSLDGVFVDGAYISWHDTTLAICILDPEPSITQSLADDVLAGKYIPCAIGQMPEDFLFLSDKCDGLRTFDGEGYKGNNDPDCEKWIHADFILLDYEGLPGYATRETYDDVHWRWQVSSHMNQFVTLKTGKKINDNEDYKYCYWQLVREPVTVDSYIISPKAF